MTLHFIHVGKTGGTAIRTTLRKARLAIEPDGNGASAAPETRYGRIQLHDHRFRLADVPAGDYAFFCVRDPISRFVSGFNSRLRKGMPRFYSEWSEGELAAFTAFPTAQQLATALGSADPDERAQAQAAMGEIRHLVPMEDILGTPRDLWERQHRIAYIARQETLDADWRQLVSLLGLPEDVSLPQDPVHAHRAPPGEDTELDEQAVAQLRAWYRRDYELVRYCDRLRVWRGWGRDGGGMMRLVYLARRSSKVPRIARAPRPDGSGPARDARPETAATHPGARA